MAAHYNYRRPLNAYFNDLEEDIYLYINRGMLHHLLKFGGANDKNSFFFKGLASCLYCIRLRGVDEEDFMLRMFPYSIFGHANSRVCSVFIDSRFLLTWDRMRHLFLEEYSIKQFPHETTYEYFERFKDFLETCPNYSLLEHVHIITFLDEMILMERHILDDMAGGSIPVCYPEDV